MKLTVLGCYSATPRSFTNPTSQVLELAGHMFLIDCGEGTQVQLRRSKVKISRISHIFISHLHGDHFFGLPGLITTMRLLGRTKELHVYGPKGIKNAISTLLKLGDSWTDYPLLFHELESKESQLVFEDEKVTVETIPLVHRVYTNGFLFKEKPKPRVLNMDVVGDLDIHYTAYKGIKMGDDVVLDNGEVIPNQELTLDPADPQSYAFCSDTLYKEELVDLVDHVDVLYHESTFLESESHLCDRTKHSTAKQAAQIAKKAEVGTLILGHYSTRYKSIDRFREEALEVFPDVELADDGKVFEF